LLLVSLVEKSDLSQNVSETLNDLPIISRRRAQFVPSRTLEFQKRTADPVYAAMKPPLKPVTRSPRSWS